MLSGLFGYVLQNWHGLNSCFYLQPEPVRQISKNKASCASLTPNFAVWGLGQGSRDAHILPPLRI